MSDQSSVQAQPPQRTERSKRTSRLTLRQRLTLSLMVVGLASLVLAGTVYIAFDLIGYRFLQIDRLHLKTELIVSRIEEFGFPDRPTRDLRWSMDLQSDVHVRSAELYDGDGSLLTSYHRSSIDGLTETPVFVEELWTTSIVRDIYLDGKRVGIVRIDGNPELFWTRLKDHASILIALFGVSTILTLGLSRRINRRFSDQVLDLAHAANAISVHRDYSIRVVRRSDDEIGILVDTFNHMITQIELRDQQLKAEVQRAEGAKVAKTKFLATMSHEIRTPINGILGMTELLKDTDLTPEQSEFTKTVRRSANALLSIINDILDFSKGEAGRFELEDTPFSLSSVINECLETVSIAACEKNIELCCIVDPDVPRLVRGDPGRLRQVLLNLLSNALKFTDEGEVVLRSTLERELEGKAEIRIEVEDSGIGIPEDRIDRLFKSFSQIDASNTRRYGGTGLGLVICKQIVEAMDGSMYVRTKEGEGSTFGFRIRLPRVDSATSDVLAHQAPSGLRILVADANKTSRESLVYMIENDCDVVAVPSGLEARVTLLRALEKGDRPFDLVLLDVRLADEFTPASEDRERELPEIPLVLLAPVTQLSLAADVSWTGRTACLARPIKREELNWCLYELISEHVLAEVSSLLPSTLMSQAKAEEEVDVRGVLVLVAEDHPVNQRITTHFLDKLGVTWELVENG